MIACQIGLGTVYIIQGLLEKALAMAQLVQSLNPSCSSVLSLGKFLSQLKRYDKALECALKALAFEERDLGKNTLQYAVVLLQIGCDNASLGQYDVALSWFQRARAIYETFNEAKTENFGLLLMNTGAVHGQLGYFSDARVHFTRAETIYRDTLPPDNPNITTFMRNIAAVNADLGNVDAADAAAAAAASTARRSQVRRVGLPPQAEGGRLAPRPVRLLQAVLLLLQGVPDRGLEGGSQGGVQDAGACC